jgi:hypothetical protein
MNNDEIVEIRSLKQSEKIKVYHGDCAVLVFAELYPQRDDKIRRATLDDCKTLLERVLSEHREWYVWEAAIKTALAELEALKRTFEKGSSNGVSKQAQTNR